MTTPLVFTFAGADRPGLMHEVSHALAARSISVVEMDTSATQLDAIADALTVQIDLEESL